jgi:hypothetical protein
VAQPETSLDAQTKRELRALLTEAGSNYAQARANVEHWFDQQMERVSTTYYQQVQLIIFSIALCVCVLGNLDTFVFAETLWRSPTVRAAVVAAAQEAAKPAPNEKAADVQARVEAIQTQAQTLVLPIGWSFTLEGPSHMPRDFVEWFKKVMGLWLTTVAATLGAPFWFDVLKKLTGARNVVVPPPPQPQTGS